MALHWQLKDEPQLIPAHDQGTANAIAFATSSRRTIEGITVGEGEAVIASAKWWSLSSGAFRATAGRTGVVDLRHYTAQVCEWGDGEPLVLVPGLAGNFDLLGPLARELARSFHVISYQLRGEDDCFALRRRFDLSDLVQDLKEFIDWRGLETPVVCGVSFGGAIALEFAARYPSAVRALVTQGVGVRYERGLVQRIASLVLSEFPLPSDSPFVNQFFNLLFGGRQPRAVFDFVTRQCWETDQSVMAHRLRLVERRDFTNRLHRVTVPACVIAGDRDLLVSPNSLHELTAGLPFGRCETLPDCGHLAFISHPRLVAEAVSNFVRSLAAVSAP
jgi:pimeloyl-ACP methyl ester carboxylesterase